MNSLPGSGSRQRDPGHLTDEQFADLLVGVSLHSTVEAHLLGCAPCRDAVQAVRTSLGEFNSFSMGWAEREAARRVRVPSRWALRLGSHPAWRMGVMSAATVIAVAIGLQFPHPSAPAALHTAVVQGAPSGAELAVDNRLMSSIDAALSDSAEPTVPVAELKAVPSHATAHLPGTVEN